MYPILFNLGPLSFYTYGLCIAIGFTINLSILGRLAEQVHLKREVLSDLSFWCLILGILGARILFVITQWDEFSQDPLAIIKLWEGGLVFWGGPLLCTPYLLYSLYKKKLPIWKSLDVATPGVVIGHAFGRIGCFFAGCCYGKPTHSIFGIRFYSHLIEKRYHGVLLHPTQLYEACALFVLFAVLWFQFKKIVTQKKPRFGRVVLSYFLSYSVIRFVIEIFRGDALRGFLFDGLLSTSQFLSILVFCTAGIVWFVRFKKT